MVRIHVGQPFPPGSTSDFDAFPKPAANGFHLIGISLRESQCDTIEQLQGLTIRQVLRRSA